MGFDFLIVGPSRLAPTVVTQSVRFHGGGALIRCNKLHASTCTVAVVVFKYSKGAVYYDIHEERKNVCDVAEFQIAELSLGFGVGRLAAPWRRKRRWDTT